MKDIDLEVDEIASQKRIPARRNPDELLIASGDAVGTEAKPNTTKATIAESNVTAHSNQLTESV